MKRVILFVFMFCSISYSLLPQPYYVSPSGNDSNSGLNTSNALATVTHAFEKIGTINDTVYIYVLPGAYNETVYIKASGTTIYPIIVKAYNSTDKPIFYGNNTAIFNGHDAVIRWPAKHSYIVLDGLKVQKAFANDTLRGIWVHGNNNIIRNCELDSIARTGIVIQGSYNTIDSNIVNHILGGSNSTKNGNNISIESYVNGGDTSQYNFIGYNILKNNPTHFGVNIFPDTQDGTQIIMSGNKIYNNYIDSTGGGIYTRFQNNLEIINNVIVQNKNSAYWPVQGGGIILDADNDYPNSHQIPIDAGAIKIYNNIIADNSDYGIKNNTSNTLYIKNNIFNNNGPNTNGYGHILIQFDSTLISTNTVVNWNLYYGTGYWRWGRSPLGQDMSSFTLWRSTKRDLNGINNDPLFQTGNYNLQYGSPAKNAGVGLQSEGVLTDYNNNPRPYWNKDYDIGAYEVQGDAQLKLGIASGTNLSFTISSPGTYWARNSNGSYNISSNSSYSNSTYTVPSADQNINNWKGWDFGWLNLGANDLNKPVAHGIYKLSHSDTTYIYIDYRDDISTYSPNMYIRYNTSTPQFEYYDGSNFQPITNGSVLQIWNINNNGVSNTTGLNNYWANALVSFPDYNTHPVLIWGPYPNTTYYRVSRYNSGTPAIVYTSTSSPFNWTDTTVYNNINQLDSGTHYFVTSIWANINTDTVSIQPTNSETWSGNIKMANVVKVPSGKSLTINPGAIINLYSTSSFNILGKLTAIGTTTNPITFTSATGTSPGSWGTITFSGSGASGSALKYANIKFGTEIDVTSGSNNVIIQNCYIDSSSMHGLSYINSTGDTAINNVIKNANTAHGIYLQSGSYVNCIGNVIKKTNSNHTGVGIYFGGGGNGVVAQNDIFGFDWGIGATWGSSPTSLDSTTNRNNRVKNCNTGIRVYNDSHPLFGLPYTGIYSNNSIDSNTINVDIDGNAPTYSSSLTAYYDWWGSAPPSTSLFQIGSQASLYYNPYSYVDSWANIPNPSIKLIHDEYTETNIKKQTADVQNSEIITGGIDNQGSNNIDSLRNGIDLWQSNKLNEAKNFFINYLKQHPDNRAAFTYLYGCANNGTTPDIINFFNSLPSAVSKQQKLLLSYLYLRQGNVDLARNINNSIIEENPNTSLAVRAKLNKFYIALYNDNDVETSTELLSEIKSQADLSSQMEISTAEDALSVHGSFLSGITVSPLVKKVDQKGIKIPSSYSLSQNYPNPFNPSTTILYSLKDAGMVKLEIFDILGRRVRTLVNEVKLPGEYKVNFIGNNLASGVYIYRLTSGTFTQVKKMQLLK